MMKTGGFNCQLSAKNIFFAKIQNIRPAFQVHTNVNTTKALANCKPAAESMKKNFLKLNNHLLL